MSLTCCVCSGTPHRNFPTHSVKLTCNHCMCVYCAYNWLITCHNNGVDTTCPMCRSIMSKKQLAIIISKHAYTYTFSVYSEKMMELHNVCSRPLIGRSRSHTKLISKEYSKRKRRLDRLHNMPTVDTRIEINMSSAQLTVMSPYDMVTHIRNTHTLIKEMQSLINFIIERPSLA